MWAASRYQTLSGCPPSLNNPDTQVYKPLVNPPIPIARKFVPTYRPAFSFGAIHVMYSWMRGD